jgi:hypothetical protein
LDEKIQKKTKTIWDVLLVAKSALKERKRRTESESQEGRGKARKKSGKSGRE